MSTLFTRKWEYVFVAVLFVIGTVLWIESGIEKDKAMTAQLVQNDL